MNVQAAMDLESSMDERPDFRRADGMRYPRFLDQLHASCDFSWYLEIGTQRGRSLRSARCASVAVDPKFLIESNVIGQKLALYSFQMTSDAFFKTGFVEKNQIAFDFAFLDGMHQFEFLLRDFMFAEAHAAPGGVIALHDCCPANFGMTVRNPADAPGAAWTGDVWKLIPILCQYRPELTMTVLDCRPTGLVLLSDLNPENRALQNSYEKIEAEWRDITLEGYGLERFYGTFEYTVARRFARQGFPLFKEA
ncbi:MAG: class I SAM-dependent methyltransferase [Pseudomonadota bacterium]